MGLSRLAAISAILLMTSSARAQSITITINNDTTRDLRVTVYDESAHPHQVISNGVVNSFATIPVTLLVNSSGYGHMSWSASTLDKDMRRCASRDIRNLNDGDTVHVYANAQCSSRSAGS